MFGAAACVAIGSKLPLKNVALGTNVQKASGLAFWFPNTKHAYELVSDTYAKLEFDRRSGWTKYLSNFYGN